MPKLDIDTEMIATLAELLQRTGLTEIEVCHGEMRVRVAKQPAPMDIAAPYFAPASVAALEPTPEPQAPQPIADHNHPGVVASPMVGTAYLAQEPGGPPFVAVGQEVREGATLLIIEAMKVMNSIRAPRSGRIAKVMVENAHPVEFGEPLMIIE